MKPIKALIDLSPELIIDLFKKMDLKSAVRLASTAKHYFNLFKNNEENLWKHYLNRDFPTAPWPLNKDYKKAYLITSISRLSKVNDFIEGTVLEFTKNEPHTLLRQRISEITDTSTLEELTTLHLDLTRAVSAPNIISYDSYMSRLSGFAVPANTPLIEAADWGYTEIVRTLIAAGAKLNAKNFFGSTALIRAAERGHTEIVQVLIQARAEVNDANDIDNTALIYASSHGHTEIVRALMTAGANINAADNKSSTALVYAKKNGHTEIVNLLEDAIARKTAASTQKPILMSNPLGTQQDRNTVSEENHQTLAAEFKP